MGVSIPHRGIASNILKFSYQVNNNTKAIDLQYINSQYSDSIRRISQSFLNNIATLAVNAL